MMKQTTVLVATIGLLAAASAGFLVAEDSSSSRPQDEKSIREISQAFARAFEKGDAPAVAAFFTDEGEYVDEGRDVVKGRAAIAKAYGEFFSKRADVKTESKTDAIRFIGKDTAAEEGTFTVKAKDSPPHASRFSTLYVRQDGRWMIALMKEWGDDTTDRTDINNLAWLIGSWESDGPEVAAKTTYEWSDSKKFIQARYSVNPKKNGVKGSSGTQIIGVDPATGAIHAWLFDSEGGIGESTWTWSGDQWVIDSSGTLADGSSTTAQNFLTRSGDDAFTWRSVKRTLDNDKLPDLGIVKVKRTSK